MGQPIPTELRLVLFDRTGSGRVLQIRVDEQREVLRSGAIIRDTWWQMGGLQDFSAEVLRNQLYIIGGYHKERERFSGSMLRFTPEEDRWTEIPGMQPRFRVASAVCRDKIYVTGGEKSKSKTTASCEVYDPRKESWEKAGMLPQSRGSHACCTDGNNLYVSGGSQDGQPLHNLWVYEDFKWSELDRLYPHELLKRRCHHSMLWVDNSLFFIGGKVIQKDLSDDSFEPKVKSSAIVDGSIEAFMMHVTSLDDSSQGELICPWVFNLPPMTYPRLHPAVHLLGRKIYVLGGTSSRGHSVLEVEYFHLDKRKWFVAFKLPPGDYSNVTCALLRFPTEEFLMEMAMADAMEQASRQKASLAAAPLQFSSDGSALFAKFGHIGKENGDSGDSTEQPKYKGWILW